MKVFMGLFRSRNGFLCKTMEEGSLEHAEACRGREEVV